MYALERTSLKILHEYSPELHVLHTERQTHTYRPIALQYETLHRPQEPLRHPTVLHKRLQVSIAQVKTAFYGHILSFTGDRLMPKLFPEKLTSVIADTETKHRKKNIVTTMMRWRRVFCILSSPPIGLTVTAAFGYQFEVTVVTTTTLLVAISVWQFDLILLLIIKINNWYH